VSWVGQLQAKGYQSTWSNTRKFMCYLLLRKSDERRFLQVVGRISQCLAAKHRSLGCEAAWLDMRKFVYTHRWKNQSVSKIIEKSTCGSVKV